MSVTLFEPALHTFLESSFGPVARDILRRAAVVEELAKQNVQAEFRSRSGNLLQSIGTFPNETPRGLEVEVGTDGAPHGKLLEEGTSEHIILPQSQRVLVSEPGHPDPLRSPRTIVNHPGTPPRPWLVPALREGFRG